MNYLSEYERWLSADVLTVEEKQELRNADQKDIESRFHALLQFGTAGLRGTMGMGTYRMNVYVVRHATQAFAQVILEEGAEAAAKGVAVCYDCRNNSRLFAETAASVLAANNIPVHMFQSLRPTPELSFAVRHYGHIAGINITASHNPKEYNGYKVYWSDGAQLPPQHATQVAAKMETLDIFNDVKYTDFETAVKEGKIVLMGKETDELFLAQVMGQATGTDAIAKVADSFHMVYTPFHGTGYELIPQALGRLGLKHLHCVPEQMVIDGNFPTVASPNPENPEGFAQAIALAGEVGADLILGSDPDADRVGIMVRDSSGSFRTLSGNQTGVLMLDYIIKARRAAGTMPQPAATLKSIVSTEMARKVAETNGVLCFDTFTGFKFLAEKKNQLERDKEATVLFSFEESYGYMLGDYVRDKDAVTAALVITEMAMFYASQGKTLYDVLMELYETYGWYKEKTLNLVMPGLDGLEKMKKLMENLRENVPAEIGGTAVVSTTDYLPGIRKTGDREEKIELRDSNVLRYELCDGTTVLVRPSGTEPKVKVYILIAGDNEAACEKKAALYSVWAEALRK